MLPFSPLEQQMRQFLVVIVLASHIIQRCLGAAVILLNNPHLRICG